MSNTTFSVGRDCQLVVIGPNAQGQGGRIDLSHVTGFESRQMTHPVRIDRMDGATLAAELPKGWEGSFELERGNAAVDDFIATAEAQFFAHGHVQPGSLYQYVAETDGSTSTYQYDGVVFRLAHAGTWRGDTAVKQKLEFFASRRKRV